MRLFKKLFGPRKIRIWDIHVSHNEVIDLINNLKKFRADIYKTPHSRFVIINLMMMNDKTLIRLKYDRRTDAKTT